MAYAFVQVVDFGNTGSAATIVSGSITLTAGNRVMFIACFANSADVSTTATDTNNNSWAKVGTGLTNFGGFGMSYSAWECRNITAGGSTAITVNLSSACTHRGLAGMEVSGLDSTAAVEDAQRQGLTNPGTATDALTTPTLTPTAAPAMVFGFVQQQSNASAINAGTGENIHACPLCGVINGSSMTKVLDKRITTTSTCVSTATATLGTPTFINWGLIVKEAAPPGIPILPRNLYVLP